MDYYSQPDYKPNNDFGALYPEAQSLDLRAEFAKILYGTFDETGVGRPFLIRFLTDTFCPCWDGVSGSPDDDCTYCDGEGYQFREAVFIGFMSRNFGSVLNPATVITTQQQVAKEGITDEERSLIFFEYSVFPNYERYSIPQHKSFDKLYELKVDDNGGQVFPLLRTAKWNLRSVTPHHGDFGRVEYFECGLEKQTV